MPRLQLFEGQRDSENGASVAVATTEDAVMMQAMSTTEFCGQQVGIERDGALQA
jgi:hypothetical protein